MAFNYKSNNNGDAVENEGNILSFGSRYEESGEILLRIAG